MALIAVTAGKGSPGVTTTSVALTAVWPREAVLAECDPAGGDVALRLQGVDGRPLRRDVGLLGLAARLRTGTAVHDGCGEHVQVAVGGLPVITGVSTPAQAAAFAPLWPALAAALGAGVGDGGDVIADCGRHQPGGPADHVLHAADLIVVVARPTVEGVTHLRGTLAALSANDFGPAGATSPVVVVLVDRAPGAACAEVAESLHAAGSTATVVGSVALDPVGAAGLGGTPTRRLDRTPLIVSARRLASRLDGYLAASRVESTATAPAATPPARSNEHAWTSAFAVPHSVAVGQAGGVG